MSSRCSASPVPCPASIPLTPSGRATQRASGEFRASLARHGWISACRPLRRAHRARCRSRADAPAPAGRRGHLPGPQRPRGSGDPARLRRSQHRPGRRSGEPERTGSGRTEGPDQTASLRHPRWRTPPAWTPPSPALRRLCELQTMRAGFVASMVEWKNRAGSCTGDATASGLAQATIAHFEAQIAAVDQAIAETIDKDDDLRGKRDLLLSIDGVGQTLAALVLAELPAPDVLRSSAAVVAYAGLNPRQFQSGTSVNRPTRISKLGNAVLRAGLYMPAMVAMRHNPAVAALAARLRAQGRLKPKQILIAAMRKLLVICFGVLKSGRPFDAALAMPAA